MSPQPLCASCGGAWASRADASASPEPKMWHGGCSAGRYGLTGRHVLGQVQTPHLLAHDLGMEQGLGLDSHGRSFYSKKARGRNARLPDQFALGRFPRWGTLNPTATEPLQLRRRAHNGLAPRRHSRPV
jgi:hypothetical protein